MTKHLINYERLLYWIDEREKVRHLKEDGATKPWSADPVFQTTYFCNVRRENDKVTRWIRKEYSPYVGHELFVHNIILSRFLNWPDTLTDIGYVEFWDPEYVSNTLKNRKFAQHKVWGNAYVVTTHGIPMDKIDYLCDRVMPSIAGGLAPMLATDCCAVTAHQLQSIEGISTFMAGQVVADLKNTPGHPLKDAPDWWTFALPGPGSRRGMDWLCGEKVGEAEWHILLALLQERLHTDGWRLCRQDIQNCLCEYDKWERVTNGTGRSKRGYDARG